MAEIERKRPLEATREQEHAAHHLALFYGRAMIDWPFGHDRGPRNQLRIVGMTGDRQSARWIVNADGTVHRAWDPDRALDTYRPEDCE